MVGITNGRLAVDAPDAVPFIEGTYSDPSLVYGFKNPCPATAARKTAYGSSPAGATKAFASAAKVDGTRYIVAPHLIRDEEAKLATSLSYVLAGTTAARKTDS